jgi:phospholipase C
VADCDLSVYGPNGFFRGFRGSVSHLRNAQLDVRVHYNDDDNGIELRIANLSADTANVTILDQYTGKKVKFGINAGRSESRYFSLDRFSGWYDFLIIVASDASIEYHFAGHLETGKDSISDPLLGEAPKHGGNGDRDDNEANNRD